MHFRALDGLRGLAILSVMLFHAQVPFRKAVEGPLELPETAWLSVTRWGWAGVDLFFVLSGFLITGILIDAKPGRGEAGIGRYLGNFYARRTLRIFPLHYAMILLFLVVVPRLPVSGGGAVAREVAEYAAIAPHQGWFWAYLGNIYFAMHGFTGHGIPDVLWSLAIEEQFYLGWPFVVLVLPRRALAPACIALAAIALSFRASLVLGRCDPVAIYVLTPGRIDGLALGALVAAWSRGPVGLRGSLRPWAFAGVAATVALGMVAVLGGGSDEYAPSTQAFGLTAIAVLSMATIAHSVARPDSALSSALSAAPLRILGKYAYALYLFHVPVQSALRAVGLRAEAFPGLPPGKVAGLAAFSVTTIVVTLGCAWLSWILLERHFLRLKRWFPQDQRGAATISSASAPAP